MILPVLKVPVCSIVYSKQSSLLVRRQEMALLLILAAVGLMIGSVYRTCHGQVQQNETDSAMNQRV